MDNKLRKTCLWNKHKELGAKCVDFAGYDMPLNYGSQIEEHHAVRVDAGVFDVSHMVVIDIQGSDAAKYLGFLLANDINKIPVGKAMYSCLCNQQGGVIDDLIVYHVSENNYRIVTNAATRDKDLNWFNSQVNEYNVAINEQADLAIISIQGPNSAEKLAKSLEQESFKNKVLEMKTFQCHLEEASQFFIAKTGYTGEHGFELILPIVHAEKVWQNLIDNNVKPCGLAARDTLRLEAGLSLYGQDMDETVTPVESGLGWTVDLKSESRDFIGRTAIVEKLKQRKLSDITTEMIGLILEGRGVLRCGQTVVIDSVGEGVVTSGIFSPTLQCGIAIARVNVNSEWNQHPTCQVMIRNRTHEARIVRFPFVRFNKSVYKSYV